jgi:hypothetical protein
MPRTGASDEKEAHHLGPPFQPRRREISPPMAGIEKAPPEGRPASRKEQAMKIRCTQCRKTFSCEAKFEAHACPAIPQDATLEELMALYEAQHAAKK